MFATNKQGETISITNSFFKEQNKDSSGWGPDTLLFHMIRQKDTDYLIGLNEFSAD